MRRWRSPTPPPFLTALVPFAAYELPPSICLRRAAVLRDPAGSGGPAAAPGYCRHGIAAGGARGVSGHHLQLVTAQGSARRCGATCGRRSRSKGGPHKAARPAKWLLPHAEERGFQLVNLLWRAIRSCSTWPPHAGHDAPGGGGLVVSTCRSSAGARRPKCDDTARGPPISSATRSPGAPAAPRGLPFGGGGRLRSEDVSRHAARLRWDSRVACALGDGSRGVTGSRRRLGHGADDR